MSITFLQELFSPYCQGDGLLCEIRCLSQDRTAKPEIKYFGLGHLNRAVQFATSEANLRDVYMGVLPRDVKASPGLGGLDNHVQQAAWFWCDVDRGEASNIEMTDFLRDVERRLPRPRMIVLSGSGGVHLYWKLSEVLSLLKEDTRDVYRAFLRRLVVAVGHGAAGIHADKSCCNLSRILRLPQTFNHKHIPPPQVVGMCCPEYDTLTLAQWDDLLPWEPLPRYMTKPERNVGKRGRLVQGIPAGLMRWAEAGYPEGHRHHDIVSAAAWLRRDTNLPDSVAYDLLRIKVQNSGGRRQITDEEVEKAWAWASQN